MSSRKSKGKSERKSFVLVYDPVTWKVSRVKRIGEKGSVTCVDISCVYEPLDSLIVDFRIALTVGFLPSECQVAQSGYLMHIHLQ